MDAVLEGLRTVPPPAGAACRVVAPSRLHLGFLDPGASLGRRFGSLGLVIDGHETVVELAPARGGQGSATAAPAAAAQAALGRASALLQALAAAWGGGDRAWHLHLAQVPPAHAGFGSGTQLALAVGRALASCLGRPAGAREIARATGRGLRSGVGIAGFEQGGLLLDGGPGRDGQPAPLLARLELPAAWRVLLVVDPQAQGLSGDAERAALAQLPPLPREAAAEICHEVLMRVLPAAADADFEPFAAGVSRVQALLGSHYAPVQHGRAFTSARVERLLNGVAARTPAGIGQSSWGPTGFALLPDADTARRVLAAVRAADLVDPALDVNVVAPRAHGASVQRPHGSP